MLWARESSLNDISLSFHSSEISASQLIRCLAILKTSVSDSQAVATVHTISLFKREKRVTRRVRTKLFSEVESGNGIITSAHTLLVRTLSHVHTKLQGSLAAETLSVWLYTQLKPGSSIIEKRMDTCQGTTSSLYPDIYLVFLLPLIEPTQSPPQITMKAISSYDS